MTPTTSPHLPLALLQQLHKHLMYPGGPNPWHLIADLIPTMQVTWKPCLCLPVPLPNQSALHPGMAHWDADGHQTGPRSRKPTALSPLLGLGHAR